MTNTVNPDVLINFVLDQSGSMGFVADATVEGVNAFLDEQRKLPGEARLSLTLFDTKFDARYVATALSEVPVMTQEHGPNKYRPGGGTALLDAVGVSIKGTEGWLAKHPDFKGKVVTVILTDGEENSSHEWHINQPMIPGDDRDLAGLIQWKQNEGWEFVFLGSGGKDWLERTFGHVVAAANFHAFEHSGVSNSETYALASSAMTQTRTRGGTYAGNASKSFSTRTSK